MLGAGHAEPALLPGQGVDVRSIPFDGFVVVDVRGADRAAAEQNGDAGDRPAPGPTTGPADPASGRRALLDFMAALGLPVRHYKLSAAWAAEKAARLKLNGRLLSRSPVSSLEELEMLRLGVEGKAAGWRTLRGARRRRQPPGP
jgi:hypothetical protein